MPSKENRRNARQIYKSDGCDGYSLFRRIGAIHARAPGEGVFPPLSYTRARTVEMGAPVTSVTFVDGTGISAANPIQNAHCRSRVRKPVRNLQPCSRQQPTYTLGNSS